MARLPAGDPAPADGALPAEALAGVGTRPFGFYVHVPFCASRCGYCDFNTYVPGERGAEQAGGYVDAVLAEIDLAARVLAAALPRVDTVFFGGGTPTLLPAGELIRILRRIDERFGLAPGAEVTTEANPESVDPAQAGGVARGRLHAPLAGDAERGAARAGDARPRALARPPGAGGRRGARRRLRAGQPRPDLRHAGRDRGRLARLARRRAERRARPPLDLLADRRARHADGRAGAPRRARRAGRGRDRRPLRDRRARARRGRDGVVRDLLVGDRRGRLVPAQPRLLGRRRLVGRRAGRAQPRRRGALVERAAPAGLERAARGRRVTGGGARAARRGRRSAWSA